VGEVLADRLARPFVDLDAEFELAAGEPVPDCIRKRGEPAFRERESALLRDVLATEQPVVLATGGGAPCHRDGMTAMRASGQVVWLDASPDVVAPRLRTGGDRPLVDGGGAAALERLAEARRVVYARSHRVVDAAREVGDVVDQVLRAIAAPSRVRVEPSHGAGYDVVFASGRVADATDELAALGPSGVLVVTDPAVRDEAAILAEMLGARGLRTGLYETRKGERAKRVSEAARLWQACSAFRLDRRGLLVAVGGGACSDLTGFVAGAWHRGVSFAICPTTVLAMADASVGGKTAIDLPGAKNQVGLFHQPRLVHVALGALRSLPRRAFRAGLAEIAKMGLLFDRALVEGLTRDARRLADGDVVALRPYLRRAVELKRDVVGRDALEAGERALLNLGHTLGHVLESFRPLRLHHGEAVAIGVVAAARVSVRLGLCDGGVPGEVEALLSSLGLPTRARLSLSAEVTSKLETDKKANAGTIQFVGLECVGRGALVPLPATELARLYREVSP